MKAWLFIIGFLLIGCGKEETPDPLIGEWLLSGGTRSWTFNSDGTFKQRVLETNEIELDASWSYLDSAKSGFRISLSAGIITRCMETYPGVAIQDVDYSFTIEGNTLSIICVINEDDDRDGDGTLTRL